MLEETRSPLTPPDPVLVVRDLQAGYGEIRALWGVSIQAEAGQVTLVLGRNGAGKTTAMRAIAGLTPIAAGTVEFRGRDISKVPGHRRARLGIAYVQEGKRVFRERTVEENLLLGTYASAMGRRARRAACERAYQRFPILADRRRSLAGSLSGGQQQMLAIAVALASEPSLLLLDEPSAGLAPAIVKDVLGVVKELCAEGLSVVLVEQNPELALAIARRVVILDLGKVVLDRDVADVDAGSVIRSTYFSIDGASSAPAARQEGNSP